MTEEEWMNYAESGTMLTFLRYAVSKRKRRLIAVACCRRVVSLLDDPCVLDALAVAERRADLLVTTSALTAAEQAALGHFRAMSVHSSGIAAWAVAFAAGNHRDLALGALQKAVEAAGVRAYHRARDQPLDPYLSRYEAEVAEQKAQSEIIRDVVGNPFRAATVSPCWLRWNDCTVRKIAQAIYEERAFDRLPILADALLDADCDNEDILAHCRGAGPHVRGCWVIDLLLGKE